MMTNFLRLSKKTILVMSLLLCFFLSFNYNLNVFHHQDKLIGQNPTIANESPPHMGDGQTISSLNIGRSMTNNKGQKERPAFLSHGEAQGPNGELGYVYPVTSVRDRILIQMLHEGLAPQTFLPLSEQEFDVICEQEAGTGGAITLEELSLLLYTVKVNAEYLTETVSEISAPKSQNEKLSFHDKKSDSEPISSAPLETEAAPIATAIPADTGTTSPKAEITTMETKEIMETVTNSPNNTTEGTKKVDPLYSNLDSTAIVQNENIPLNTGDKTNTLSSHLDETTSVIQKTSIATTTTTKPKTTAKTTKKKTSEIDPEWKTAKNEPLSKGNISSSLNAKKITPSESNMDQKKESSTNVETTTVKAKTKTANKKKKKVTPEGKKIVSSNAETAVKPTATVKTTVKTTKEKKVTSTVAAPNTNKVIEQSIAETAVKPTATTKTTKEKKVTSTVAVPKTDKKNEPSIAETAVKPTATTKTTKDKKVTSTVAVPKADKKNKSSIAETAVKPTATTKTTKEKKVNTKAISSNIIKDVKLSDVKPTTKIETAPVQEKKATPKTKNKKKKNLEIGSITRNQTIPSKLDQTNKETNLKESVNAESEIEQSRRLLAPSNPSRILCIVHTEEERHSQIEAIAETWGWRCDGFFAASTLTNETIGTVNLLYNDSNQFGDLWQKSRAIWAYVYDHYMDDFDFFFFSGDDVHLIVENLRDFLWSLADSVGADRMKNEPLYFGQHVPIDEGQSYFVGGAPGYVINKVTLQRMIQESLPTCHQYLKHPADDRLMSICLQRIGIYGNETTDSEGKQRFHVMDPDFIAKFDGQRGYFSRLFKYWGEIHGFKTKADIVSTQSISFHFLNEPIKMKAHHAILYRYCPIESAFGNSVTMAELLHQLSVYNISADFIKYRIHQMQKGENLLV